MEDEMELELKMELIDYILKEITTQPIVPKL